MLFASCRKQTLICKKVMLTVRMTMKLAAAAVQMRMLSLKTMMTRLMTMSICSGLLRKPPN